MTQVDEFELGLSHAPLESSAVRRVLAALLRYSDPKPPKVAPQLASGSALSAVLAERLGKWSGNLETAKALDLEGEELPEVLLDYLEGTPMHEMLEQLGELRDLDRKSVV